MSPHLLLIIILSVCSLLLVFIFSLQKKQRQLKDHLLKQSNNQEQHATTKAKTAPEIFELLKRYQFFAGENLNKAQGFIKNNELNTLERLIAEKFRNQQKHQPEKLAKQTLQKLLQLVDG